MALTQIDIDDEALREAMAFAGVRTKKDMVNMALREFSAQQRRVAELKSLVERAAGWDYEAWREQRERDKDPAA